MRHKQDLSPKQIDQMIENALAHPQEATQPDSLWWRSFLRIISTPKALAAYACLVLVVAATLFSAAPTPPPAPPTITMQQSPDIAALYDLITMDIIEEMIL